MPSFHLRDLPFPCDSLQEFPSRLSEWIGDVFYEHLPDQGYDIRDEQVYTAFQIADAIAKGRVHMAEAGLGTGKTLAYLASALALARLTGRPAVIACATDSLQDQLAGGNGDIDALSRALGIEIDARQAKHPSHFVCNVKVDELTSGSVPPDGHLSEALAWAAASRTGERSEVPNLPDSVWAELSWDETLPCDTCPSRGFCRMIKARNRYRRAADFIVCDHDVFFADLWTRSERIADGLLPLLPAYSMVVFDEGHRILLPAAKAAGRRLVGNDVVSLLSVLEHVQEARFSLLQAVVAVQEALRPFFNSLKRCVVQDDRSERLTVQGTERLRSAATTLSRAIRMLHHELETERSLHTETEVPFEEYQGTLEYFDQGLVLLQRGPGQSIAWVERRDKSIWVVPREIADRLQSELLQTKIPVVFSSATLSSGGDFEYFARSIGFTEQPGERLSTSTIAGPFDYRSQALVYLPRKIDNSADEKDRITSATRELVSLLEAAEGRALVLTDSAASVKHVRKQLHRRSLPHRLLWEGDADRGHLLTTFKEDVGSVLVGSSFWEGIDVPGPSLSLVIVWNLPFPPTDPILDAQRQEASARGEDPLHVVDYPEMSLRLKQGCGRLIRTESDRGVIALLQPVRETPWERYVMEALPPGAPVTDRSSAVTDFLRLETSPV